MDYDALEQWAVGASQSLQDFCDNAQEAAGNPYGENELPDIRLQIEELNRIINGLPTWQTSVRTGDSDSETSILI